MRRYYVRAPWGGRSRPWFRDSLFWPYAGDRDDCGYFIFDSTIKVRLHRRITESTREGLLHHQKLTTKMAANLAVC